MLNANKAPNRGITLCFFEKKEDFPIPIEYRNVRIKYWTLSSMHSILWR